MNKKVIVLAVLLAGAGFLVVRATVFSGPPANYKVPTTAQAATNPAAGEPAPAAGAAAQPGKSGAGAAPVNVKTLAKDVQEVKFQYDPVAVGRNPMAPLVGPQAVLAAATALPGRGGAGAESDLLTQQLAVTGIIWDKKFPVAVINDDVVAPGDSLSEGIVVKTIEPDKVVLAVRDKLVPLPLKRLEEQ